LPVRIRLRRTGCKKRPSYRVVVANSTSPRDGRFIETLGYYDPLTDPSTIKIDEEKAKLPVPRRAAVGKRGLAPEARGDSGAVRAGEGGGEGIGMKALVELLVTCLVDDPAAVQVVETEEEGGTFNYEVHVAPQDTGKVIGKQGKIANAIRTVVKAAAAKADAKAFVEIVS